MFYFQTNALGFTPEFLGRVRLAGSLASLAGAPPPAHPVLTLNFFFSPSCSPCAGPASSFCHPPGWMASNLGVPGMQAV